MRERERERERDPLQTNNLGGKERGAGGIFRYIVYYII